MKDDCYEVYIQLKKILEKAMDCLTDEDFQLLLITLIAKSTLTKVGLGDLQRRVSDK